MMIKETVSTHTLLMMVTAMTTAQTTNLQPVDQSVADLDLLSTSLRHVETGLRTHGQQTALYRLELPIEAGGVIGSPGAVYYRFEPGLTARVDRLDYLVRVGPDDLGFNIQPRFDGEFVEILSANTVFDLDPWRHGPANQDPTTAGLIPDDPGLAPSSVIDYRIDARIDTRIDGDSSHPPRTIIPPDVNVIELYRRAATEDASIHPDHQENQPGTTDD